ncbi:MAG: RNA polymerase sigma factor SigZ [Gammaproteobacteria bacterium]|jgi:RNA polymerase sigma-70 factor (ECF subfamily)|nr:RNA polymerase sigma factor SigZ [Gammaproteobacteria bacterium]
MDGDSERIWHDYHARLLGFIAARVSDTTEAEDLLQEVFLRIHRHIDSLESAEHLQGWIYRITRNVIIDHHRKQRPTVDLPDDLEAPETEVDDVHHELEGCLAPMIAALPDPYRHALQMTELEGLTQREFADREGLSISGAKSRVQRGRAMVKAMMLDCCHLEFDHQGRILDYTSNHDGCGPRCDRCS